MQPLIAGAIFALDPMPAPGWNSTVPLGREVTFGGIQTARLADSGSLPGQKT